MIHVSEYLEKQKYANVKIGTEEKHKFLRKETKYLKIKNVFFNNDLPGSTDH